MSHTVCSMALITDPDVLARTIARIPGAKLDELKKMGGKDGVDDYQYITIPGARYNAYIQREPDGTWRLKWDSDDRVLNTIFGKDGALFMTMYAEEASRKYAETTGDQMITTELADGNLRIELVQSEGKKIVNIVDRTTGKMTISPEGYGGTACVEATKKLEETLGLREPVREPLPEMYQKNDQIQEVGGA